ncbi:MAG: Nif3-like dinuclear metal center hexameric protein [Anaerolineae bacterium]|nr:Nif3-like dinuclear metal center hexameric protein [Anaerolineae bacterium]
MLRDELVRYLDWYLRIPETPDYGPQGLQVEGADEISRVAFTVDSGLPCIEAALKVNAQMLIVHHGLFWGAQEPIRGAFGRKVRRLLSTNLSLYAAHLALDAHADLGNNVELARLLELQVDKWFCNAKGTDIGVICNSPDGFLVEAIADILGNKLSCETTLLQHGPLKSRRIAIVSGDAAGHIGEAAALGADTFITGETSHAHHYAAIEYGMNVIYAGHYATETVGLKALGRHINGRYGLETVFIDLPTKL